MESNDWRPMERRREQNNQNLISHKSNECRNYEMVRYTDATDRRIAADVKL